MYSKFPYGLCSHTNVGQPKRHLLTSGWSTFVSSKKLVPGDSFIFLRFSLSLSLHQHACKIKCLFAESAQVFLFYVNVPHTMCSRKKSIYYHSMSCTLMI